MRTYQINVSGKDYTVEIKDLNASPVNVLVDGKAFQVTLSEQGTPVQVVPRVESDDEFEVYVPTVAPTFIETAVEPQETRPEAPAPTGDVHEVASPMPGKILDIAVQVGTPVKQGDTLCNLEAMKMKSPIRSTADGTVSQILISEGQNVNFGDVLFTVQ